MSIPPRKSKVHCRSFPQWCSKCEGSDKDKFSETANCISQFITTIIKSEISKFALLKWKKIHSTWLKKNFRFAIQNWLKLHYKIFTVAEGNFEIYFSQMLLCNNQKSQFEVQLNPLSAKPTKWSNTLKQFVGNLPTNFLSVLDHFVKFALCKSLDWFLYDNGPRHERVKWLRPTFKIVILSLGMK